MIKENKGLIMFFIAIVLFALWFGNQVKEHDQEVTNAQNSQIKDWSE